MTVTASESVTKFEGDLDSVDHYPAVVVMVGTNGMLRMWVSEGMQTSPFFQVIMSGIERECREMRTLHQPQGRA